MRMTHSFPFEQFQCDTRLRRRSDHGCLAIKGKKADETPGTKEMRQGLWGAQAVTCIVLLLSFSLSLILSSCLPISLFLAVNPLSLSLRSSSLFSTRFHRDLSSFGTHTHTHTHIHTPHICASLSCRDGIECLTSIFQPNESHPSRILKRPYGTQGFFFPNYSRFWWKKRVFGEQ